MCDPIRDPASAGSLRFSGMNHVLSCAGAGRNAAARTERMAEGPGTAAGIVDLSPLGVIIVS